MIICNIFNVLLEKMDISVHIGILYVTNNRYEKYNY